MTTSEATFKTGDRVQLVQSLYGDLPHGAQGTVTGVVKLDPSRLYVKMDEYPDPLAGVFGPEGWALLASEVERVAA